MADIVSAMPDKPKKWGGDCTGYPGRYGFFQAEYSNIWLDNIQLPPGLSRVKIKLKNDGGNFIWECSYYNFSDNDFQYITEKDASYWRKTAASEQPNADEIPYFGGVNYDGNTGSGISMLTDNLYSYKDGTTTPGLIYSFSQSMARNYDIMRFAVYNFENPDTQQGPTLNGDVYPFMHVDTFKLESAESVKIKE